MIADVEIAVEAWKVRDLDARRAAEIGELIDRTWPKPSGSAAVRAAQLASLAHDYPEQGGPRCFVARIGDDVGAHACLIPRPVRCGEIRFVVAGLSRVCTAVRFRGRGLGEAVVRAALAAVDRGEFPWALFQTTPQVEPFYRRLGCLPATNRLINSLGEDPQARPFWDDVAMRYPATGDWPQGTIDLLGPGF